jgi:hypothetical protein
MFWETDPEAAQFVNNFQDVTSADIYWFTDPNVSSGSEGGVLLNNGNPLTVAQTRLAANYGYTVDRMRELDGMDGVHQPIWAFVEVGWPFTETAAQGARTIQPEEITAAVWHSIIAGARGIVYFNHSFGGPNDSEHVLRDPAYAAQRTAVDSTNALIEQLAPVLNSPFDDAFVTVSPTVRVMAKFSDGGHYVFAGSTQHAASTATFTLAGVTSGTASVVGESRTISITGGQFSDNFADGNAIHIYQINAADPFLSGASTETYVKMYGESPSAVELDTLVAFATNQYNYALNIHVPHPLIYVHEALGTALATVSDTGSIAFKSNWGPSAIASDVTFVSLAYGDVFGHAGSSAQLQHFIDQINFVTGLYTASGAYGTDAGLIDLLARGAIYGQMLGVNAELVQSVSAADSVSMAVPLIGVSDALIS